MRSWATADLLTDLKYLLVDGYERDPAIRARGPVPCGSASVGWFCVVLRSIIGDFIASRRVWKGHEVETLEQCEAVIRDWGTRHGASADEIAQKTNIIHNAIPLFKASTLCGLGDDSSVVAGFLEWRDWVNKHPEVKNEAIEIRRYFLEEDLVNEFLKGPDRRYNEYESHPFFARLASG